MEISKHAEIRCKQRGIPNEILSIIGNLGRTTHAPGGAMKIFFGNKEYERTMFEIKKIMKLLERAKGGTLIMIDDKVVTTYKK